MKRREFVSLFVGSLCSFTFPSASGRQRPRCVCGLLQELQRLTSNLLVADPDTGFFSLVLSPSLMVSKPFCVACGGHARMMFVENAEICCCGFCEIARKLAPSLVTFNDHDSGQFHFRCQGQHNNLVWIYFCPRCGGLEPTYLANQNLNG